MRPSVAIIDLNKLKNNYSKLRQISKSKYFLAVVKANAYGHGAVEIVNSLENLKNPPDFYGVAYIEEALELRLHKITKPILLFDPVSEYNLDLLEELNVTATITNIEQLKLIKKYKPSKKIPVHIKVDTGMGRLGVSPEEFHRLFDELIHCKYVEIKGVYTHFASSDAKDLSTFNEQLVKFKKIESSVSNSSELTFHAANSGAILRFPDSHFDMVRAGISLYGYLPSLEFNSKVKLEPVMSIHTEINEVSLKKKGSGVSYNSTHILSKDTFVGSLPLGYADGISRNLSNNMKVLFKGSELNQIGTVTMDRIMINLEDSNAKKGDLIVLLGKSGNKVITAWDWAYKLKTIPYEITCGITNRVMRFYTM